MSDCHCNVKFADYHSENIYTWCTNCGNYGITAATKRALVAAEIPPHQALMCFDIGCNGNGNDKIAGYRFHGLHGRVLPFAAGAAVANPEVHVIASAGDGATLGEGINHLIHAVRHDFNITFLLHNNHNYGLTTGQASPTTPVGVAMTDSPQGPDAQPLNVTDLVLRLNPSFVARGFSGNVKQLTEIIHAGINHKGFSFIEIMQDCPTYNKATPHEWYMERYFDVETDKNYDKTDLAQAQAICQDLTKKIAMGVLYEAKSNVDFYSRLEPRKAYTTSLVQEVQATDIQKLAQKYR